jgi:GNAT superfamily N-acetyltransferase
VTEIVVAHVEELPADFEELLVQSVAEGFSFLTRLRDEWVAGKNRFDGPGEALFVARVGGTLVGVCGLNLDPFASEPRVGRLRRLYVSPILRRKGVARILTDTAISVARRRFSAVRLRTPSPGAAAFYESFGFLPVESDANVTHELRF